MTEKVIVFIDGTNLFYGLKDDHKRLDLDYQKFASKLVAGRSLVRVYYYTAIPNQEQDPERYKNQQKFLDAIQRVPYYKVVKGRLEPRQSGSYVEKGVDISMAVDMLDMAFTNTYETAIIVSGDADFVHAVEVAQRLGKHVENCATKSCSSYELQKMCDTFTLLDRAYLSDCWRGSRTPNNGQ